MRKKCNYNFTFAFIFLEHVSLLFFLLTCLPKSININKIHYSVFDVDLCIPSNLEAFIIVLNERLYFSVALFILVQKLVFEM